MISSVFDGIWEFARALIVFSPDGTGSREFLGFLEPRSLTDYKTSARKKPAILPKEEFHLVAHPAEDFYDGQAKRLSRGGEIFEILSIKPVYAGEEITHRECVLLGLGKADVND